MPAEPPVQRTTRPARGAARVRLNVVADRVELTFRGLFTKEDVALVRAIPGRSWDPDRRVWLLPGGEATLAAVRDAFGVTLPEPDPRARETGGSSDHQGDPFERFREHLHLRGFSPRTRKVYLGHVRRFLTWAADAPPGDIVSRARAYLVFLVGERNVSRSYHNQAVSALKILLHGVQSASALDVELPRPKREHRLPCVLDREETARFLDALRHPKHRALVTLMYSAGLRVGEVVRVRPEDLDVPRGLLRVREGKGSKDRVTLLSKRALALLGAYTEAFRPQGWLFPGERPGRHLTARSVQKVIRACARRAGIAKRVTPHTLRHSFATHLLESGTDLRFIQELLGHASSRTTEIYTHVTSTHLSEIRSPFDQMRE
jgi:site-specific recombinase XerD